MGRRGPAPTPTKLRVLRGNPRQHALPKGEPKPPIATPRCPSWLPKAAKREWRRLAPQLEELGLMTAVDRDTLAGYCLALVRAIEADAVIAENGLTLEIGDKGYVQQRPEVAIAFKAWQLVAKFAAEFGLTPSARTRISVPERGKRGKLREFLEDDEPED